METTSKKVAAIAGKILQQLAKPEKLGCLYLFVSDGKTVLKLADVKALAASCLTQSPDRPKKSAPSKPLDYPRRRRKS